MDNIISTAQDDQPKPPGWVAEFNRQIKPGNWCLPVEDVWRRHGWVPPSRECPETMRKHETYRRWQLAGETQS